MEIIEARLRLIRKFILVSLVLQEPGFLWLTFSNWYARESRLRQFSLIIFQTFKKTTFALASIMRLARLNPTNLSAVHKELKRVLETYV